MRAQSSPQAVSLAKKLRAAGAKMYGAFWCSHCQEQKAEFGAAAQKDLPYVECYPQGYHKVRASLQRTSVCQAHICWARHTLAGPLGLLSPPWGSSPASSSALAGIAGDAPELKRSAVDGQGTKIEPACAAAGLEGFPSWIINGRQYSGEQTFEQLEAALAKQ